VLPQLDFPVNYGFSFRKILALAINRMGSACRGIVRNRLQEIEPPAVVVDRAVLVRNIEGRRVGTAGAG
jgi:hypothetical protein